jgi:hypothetical protein
MTTTKNEERGSGLTSRENMRRLQDTLAEQYTRALDQAGVKGSSKATNEESFKSGMRAMLHHLRAMGVIVVIDIAPATPAEPRKVSRR